jgi:phosphopantetheine--protein transferase-like protein
LELIPFLLIGIGCDLAYIPRFSGLITRHCNDAKNERGFLQRLYKKMLHEEEVKYCLDRFQPNSAENYNLELHSQYLSSRWAVKEAFTKAIGRRVLFPEINIKTKSMLNADNNSNKGGALTDPRPQLFFRGELASLLQQLNILSTHCSISHDHQYTMAQVILETKDK